MKKTYLIAGCYLSLIGQEGFFPTELSDFEVEDETCVTENNLVQIVFADKVEDKQEFREIINNDELAILENDEEIAIRFKQFESVIDCYIQKTCMQAVICINPNTQARRNESFGAIRNIFFYYLQRMGRMVIHSTSILYDGKAWLFSAMAGTGKSTHVEMWRKCEYDFEDINGDMAACYIEDDEIVVAGLPWCGTSGISSNQTAPLGGILFLERGHVNQIQKMTLLDKMTQLVARNLTPGWNRECLNRNIEGAEQIVERVNLAKLVCLPNEEAAKVAKAYFDKCIKSVII